MVGQALARRQAQLLGRAALGRTKVQPFLYHRARCHGRYFRFDAVHGCIVLRPSNSRRWRGAICNRG